MELYVTGKAPVTVANAFVLLRSGGCRESTASATTGTVTNMTALSAQGTGCATVAAVSAGTAGLETPVRSGWERSIEQDLSVQRENIGAQRRTEEI